ncbi:hypothetical protein NMG60_11036259 [Bertholletia excelsa]
MVFLSGHGFRNRSWVWQYGKNIKRNSLKVHSKAVQRSELIKRQRFCGR